MAPPQPRKNAVVELGKKVVHRRTLLPDYLRANAWAPGKAVARIARERRVMIVYGGKRVLIRGEL